MVVMEAQPRLGWTVALSAAMHLLLLVMAARLPRPKPILAPSHLTLIPVALIGNPGGANGGAAPAPETVAPPALPPPPAPAVLVKQSVPPRPAKQVVTRAKKPSLPAYVATRPPAPATTVPSSASRGEVTDRATMAAGGPGTGTSGEGTDAGRPGRGGRGTGSGGGAGGGDARVAYAANPRPEYPLLARRMGMEGVVLLSVLVRRDGGVGDIDVQKSSGFPALDDAALRTVRSRWRFVPARKDGEPVDARVTVPIRFHLSDEG